MLDENTGDKNSHENISLNLVRREIFTIWNYVQRRVATTVH
jgi:hypothetical protein